MKQNDWIALNLNIVDTNIDVDNLRAYNITPNNTGLKDIEYYKDVPQVVKAFTDKNTGLFNEEAFTAFYDSAQKSYNTFVSDDYVTDLIENMPSARNDIFAIGRPIQDNSAYIVNMRDPQRHTMGLGNIFEFGAPVFSEREVAQGNKVLDENGKELNWTPEDKGGLLKALFRPTLALAIYEEDEYDAAGNLIHQKGERKYNDLGDPIYQILGKNQEIYGRDILHYADTLSKEGTFANKIDIFDRDGLDNNTVKTLLWATAKIVPYLTPLGYAFGAIEAATALGQTIPVLTKMLNGMITNDNSNSTWQKATAVENFMSRFGSSQSDYGQQHRWGLEGIAQMVVDSAGQLYSQRLIPKIPEYLAKLSGKKLSTAAMKRAQSLSLAYMATTSAKDVYGEYKQAGLDERTAGVGALATMLAYYTFMQNDYFKDMIFRDPAMELPQLKVMLSRNVKATTEALAARQAKNEGVAAAETAARAISATASQATNEIQKKWYNTVFTTVGSKLKAVLPTLKNLSSAESPYLFTSRAFNEGVEEVMEEGVSDFFKGLTLGLDSLGVDVKAKDADKIDFGFSPENFLERYATAFVGGAIGGAVFEGLTQWDNKVLHRNISRVADLEDVDEQMDWYIRNGYKDELISLINNWEKKGKFGTKDLSWDYTVKDGKIIYKQGDDKNNQNSAIAEIMRQRIRYKAAMLEALGLNINDNEILLKAISDIKTAADEAGYTDVQKFQEEKLRDARIEFLKQTGIDKHIVSDVADIQKELSTLQETIEQKKEEARNVPDKYKDQIDENTPEIKRLQKLYDDEKKRLDDILSGKAASEYLARGIFVANKTLNSIYLSELAGDDKTFAEQSVQNYTRIRYGENYDELDAGSKEIMDAEYRAWVNNSLEKKDRIANALRIHRHLTDLITPVVQKQVADYYGYKLEDNRLPIIVANLMQIQQTRLETMQKQLAELTANPNTDPNAVLQLTQQIEQQQAAMSQFSDPKQVLDTRLTEDEKGQGFLSRYIALFEGNNPNLGEILKTTVEYYRQLNSGKIVSEFSNDILKETFKALQELGSNIAANNFEAFKKAGYKASNSFIDDAFSVIFNTALAKPEMQTTFHDITDSEGNTSSKSESDILKELYAAWDDNIRHDDGSGIFTYNGKTQHFLDHLMDTNILSNLTSFVFDEESGEDLEVNPFSSYINTHKASNQTNYARVNLDAQKEIAGLVNAVIESFSGDIDGVLTALQNLESRLDDFIRLHQLDAPNGRSVIASLFGVDMFDALNELKQLRSEMIHTPILEWIQALSLEVRGMPTNLWKMLQDEIKGLESKDRLEQYTISDPFALNELKFLQSALLAARGIVTGMAPNSVNAQINKLRKLEDWGDLFTFDNDTLAEVYLADLDVLSQRINYLLDLHAKNFTGTVRQKKEAFIKNAPKIISAVLKTSTAINEDDPDVFIVGKLKAIGIDLNDLWQKAGGDNITLAEVNENNFANFWKAYRAFQNAIYDEVSKWAPTNGKKNTELAKILVSGFTDLWKFKTSELTHQDSSKVENFDVLMWLASTIAINPRDLHGLIKTVKSTSGINPFFDQLLGIQTGFATIENSDFFNAIVDAIYNEQEITVAKLTLDDSDKKYLKDKTRIHNAVFFDGAAGTGKSQVELRYIRELRRLKHPEIAAIAVSEYEERTKALKTTLAIADTDVFTKAKLEEILLGRPLTSDDFEIGEAHAKTLKQSVKDEIRKRTNIWAPVLGTRTGLDIYIDESGFLSEADFQFFEETLGAENIHFIYAGDEMQNGCVVETKNGITNSGVFDVMGIKTPRLNLSMRAGNLGMIKNLQHTEAILKQFLDIYREQPWINIEDLTKKRTEKFGSIPPFKFRYFEDENSLFGIRFTDDANKALEKLDRISIKVSGEPKVVVITDDVAKWQSKRSENIDVLDVKSVQGGQYDYALIDVKFGNSEDFEYLRNVYTLISRAKTGVYITGQLGNAFPKTSSADMDSTASIVVNPTAASGDSDIAMEDYEEFFDALFKEDTWNGPVPVITPPGTAPVTPPAAGPIAIPKPPVVTPKPATKPGLPEFNIEDFLKSIREEGINSPYLKTWYSKSKNADYENYKKYFEFLANNSDNGNALVSKDYIDWLFSDASDTFLFTGSRSLLNGLSTLTEERKTEFKKLIRGLAMDLFLLDKNELRKKYVDGVDLLEDWAGTGKIFAGKSDRIQDFFKTVVDAKSEEGIEVYAVRDGEYTYLYHIGNGFAVPIGRVKGLLEEGGIRINPTVHTPLILISTNGGQFKPISEVLGNYAELSDDAYIVQIDPEKVPTVPGSGLTEFIVGNTGKPMGLISATFGDHNDNSVMETVADRDDPQKIHRIDRTGLSNGVKRLDGISNWVSLSQWIELTTVIQRLRDDFQSVSREDQNKLVPYVKRSALEALELIKANPDPSNLFANLAKVQLLSPKSRAMLTTALMRFFYNNRETNPNDYTSFLNNFLTWNGESYTSNDGLFIRQRCYEFSIYGESGIETYHILLNSDSGDFRVVTEGKNGLLTEEVLVGNLTPEQWLTLDNLDPVTSTRNLLTLIRDAKTSGRVETSDFNTADLLESSAVYQFFTGGNISDEQIVNLLSSGNITFSVSTRSETLKTDDNSVVNQQIRYFAPFDTDVLALLKDITVTENGDLDQFLKTDSKFKYQFLVNTPGDDELNPYWLRAKNASRLLSDIGEVLPPLFEIGRVTSSSNAKFRNLGSLNHKFESSNPADNQLYIERDAEGKVKSWTPQKYFIVSNEDFKKYTGIEMSTPTITIVRATPNSITVKEGSSETTIRTSVNDELFAGMPRLEGRIGDQEILNNGEQKLVKTETGEFVIRDKAKTYPIQVVYENNSKVGIWAGETKGLIEFSKTNPEEILTGQKRFADGVYVGSTGEGLLFSLWFLNKNNLSEFNRDGGSNTYTIRLTTDGKLLLPDNTELQVDSNIIRAIAATGMRPIRPQKKSDVQEAVAALIRTHKNLTPFRGRTVKQANRWALENAIVLDGIFEYDENTHEFYEKVGVQELLLMSVAKWVKQYDNIDAQDFINSNPNIQVIGNESSESNVVEVILGDKNWKFTFMMNSDGELSLKPIVPETPAREVPVINFDEIIKTNLTPEQFAMFSDSDLSNLKLYLRSELGEQVNTGSVEFQNWVDNITPEIGDIIVMLTDLVIKQQAENACNI